MFRVSAQHFSYTALEWYNICGCSSQIRQTTIQPNPPPTLITCVLRKVSQVSQQGETQCENSYCPYVLSFTHNTFSIPTVLDQVFSKSSDVAFKSIYLLFTMLLRRIPTQSHSKWTVSLEKLVIGQHDNAELLANRNFGVLKRFNNDHIYEHGQQL